MKKLLSVLLTITMLISSCGFDGTKSNDNEEIIVNSESGNILRLGIESVDTFNPIFTKSVSVYDCMNLIFEPLFTFDEGLNPIGVLAKDISVSEDGYTYTIKTKDGIVWHDGTPFNSHDVLHTLNLIRFQQSTFSNALSCVASVSAPDNNTVVIGVKRPVPNFTALLSFPIVQASVTTENLSEYIPIGTGPYRYNSKSTTDEISLIRNDNWYSSPPAINEIRLNILKDATAVSTAFNASKIHAITSDIMDLNTTTPRGEVQSCDYISNNMIFLGINNSKHKLSGANTRKAVSYLIDKQEIVATEMFSRAVAAEAPINPSAWYSPSQTAADYDAEYITEVLSLDGWQKKENGEFYRIYEKHTDSGEVQPVGEYLSIEILVNDGNEERLRIANKIGNAFNAFGIDTAIRVVSFEEYSTKINEKSFDMFVGEIKLPDNMDQYSLLCDENNYFAYKSGAMSDAVYRLGVSGSTEAAKEAYGAFYNIFREEMPFVPLFFRKESVIFEKSLSGTSMPTVFTAFSNPHNWYLSYTS